MAESEPKHYSYQVGSQTLALLKSYKEFEIPSRTFMLKEHSNMLERIRARSDHFATYPERQLTFLEARIYVELLERTCQLVEDFSILSYSLWDDLAQFPKRLVSGPNPPKLLKELSLDHHWLRLLRYPEAEGLGLEDAEKVFLQQHYDKNIQILRNLSALLARFWGLYQVFYAKLKHGNSLIYGFQSADIAGEPTILIPVVFNSKRPEAVRAIPVSYSMYGKLQNLFNVVAELSLDLLGGAILFIERNGTPMLEHVCYYRMSAADNERLRKLVDKYDQGVSRTNISVEVVANTDMKVFQPFLDFYDDFDLGAFADDGESGL